MKWYLGTSTSSSSHKQKGTLSQTGGQDRLLPGIAYCYSSCLTSLLKVDQHWHRLGCTGSCGAVYLMRLVQASGSAPGFSTSWLRTRRLAIGPIPQLPSHWLALRQQGVQSIFSCCEADEGQWQPPQEWPQRRVPLPDHRQPNAMTSAMLDHAINAALDLYSTGEPLYLHCWAGKERSPLVAIGLLCRAESLNLFEALAQVRSQHPSAQPLIPHLLILESLLAS